MALALVGRLRLAGARHGAAAAGPAVRRDLQREPGADHGWCAWASGVPAGISGCRGRPTGGWWAFTAGWPCWPPSPAPTAAALVRWPWLASGRPSASRVAGLRRHPRPARLHVSLGRPRRGHRAGTSLRPDCSTTRASSPPPQPGQALRLPLVARPHAPRRRRPLARRRGPLQRPAGPAGAFSVGRDLRLARHVRENQNPAMRALPRPFAGSGVPSGRSRPAAGWPAARTARWRSSIRPARRPRPRKRQQPQCWRPVPRPPHPVDRRPGAAGPDRRLGRPPTHCDVLLVPHHGSRQSDPEGLAAWSTPRLGRHQRGSALGPSPVSGNLRKGRQSRSPHGRHGGGDGPRRKNGLRVETLVGEVAALTRDRPLPMLVRSGTIGFRL